MQFDAVITGDAQCTTWQWYDNGGGTQVVLGSQDGTSTSFTWMSAGTYTVQLRAACVDGLGVSSNESTSVQVTVVNPPTNQFITITGGAANITPTSATVCLGNSYVLLPPSNARNCRWSVDTNAPFWAASGGGIRIHSGPQPYTSAVYTLQYDLYPASPCPLSLTFTVSVKEKASPAIIAGTERFGPGSLLLTVQNQQPSYTYTWYETATGPAVGQGPTFQTPSLSTSRSYYLAVTSCEEGPRQEVKALLRQVRITVDGQVPTQTLTGTQVVLEADPGNGPFMWLRDEEEIDGATGRQLTVTEAGRYVVRLTGVSGPEAESLPVDVLPFTQLKEWTVLRPEVTDPQEVAGLSPGERGHTVTYANGLGLPIQQLGVQAGPTQEDIVQHIGYEGTGSTAQTFLPFPVAEADKAAGAYEADPLARLDAYYASKGGAPFSTTTTEASPLGRPLEQTQTGQAWAGHSSRVSYAANTATEVRYWAGLDGSRFYPEGQLLKEIALDPDNRRTEVFKDQLGRVVLQRKVDGNQHFDTYTVYADAGYVQAVIPPQAVRIMDGTRQWNIQDAGFKYRWLYQYSYDDQGRLVERKLPGAEPMYLVYDPYDRPVLVQDGNHRAAKQWLFTKFDAQNRPVAEGIWQSSQSRIDVQADADNFAANQTQDYENRTADGYTTNHTYPSMEDGVDGAVLLSLTFYDDYDLNLDGDPDFRFAPEPRLATTEQPEPTDHTRGLATATRRRVVAPGNQYENWLTTALFYDQYSNVVQKQGDNLLQSSRNQSLADITTLVYRDHGFVPQVLRTVKQQEYGTGTPVVVSNRFAYDPAGRLLHTWQQHEQHNTPEPEVLVSSNDYKGLGELTQKRLHGRSPGAKFLQYEDFAYNQHGQLQRINNSDELLLTNPENDLFAFTIDREQVASGGGNTPRFDGGISAVSWATHNAAQRNQPERQRTYRFAYDGLGRLTDATFAARTGPRSGWNLEVGAYDEKNIGYDANGNITALQRYTQQLDGKSPQLIDDLKLYYTAGTDAGNQMTGAYDWAQHPQGFKNSVTTGSSDYQYDPNGSLIRDGNKGIDYMYNALNKVERQKVGGNSIATTYDASGTVLRKETKTNDLKTEYYIDGFVYEYSATFQGLRSVPTPEGRALMVQPTDTKLTYEYHLRDHLGNLRVGFRALPGTEELRLSSERDEDDGPYPQFENVAATRSQATPAYDGDFVAEVTNQQQGPAIAVPVAHEDHLRVQVYYKTPHGVQYSRVAAAATPSALPQVALALAPALLPLAPATRPDGRPSPQVAPGLQVSVSGLLSALGRRRQTPNPALAGKPGPSPPYAMHAYLAWTLFNADGKAVQKGSQLLPVFNDMDWHPLELELDIDLSSEEARTGTLRLQEVNDASRPVYFDLLTIAHPKDEAVVSQENHYYPFGMALSGVAVNTLPAPELSKLQYNGGSELQDELLGSEQGIYSTFFRSYDPVTGRFQGVDPLADDYADFSPYSLGFNNPVNFNDPDGDEPVFVNGRYMTPHVFNGGEGGGWDGSTLSFMMSEQGWSGTSYGYGRDGNFDNVEITITTTGVNYLGDGNGNEDLTTAMPWSYSTTIKPPSSIQQGWHSLSKSDLSTYYSSTHNGQVGDANQLGATFEGIFGRLASHLKVLPYTGRPFTGTGRNTVPDFRGPAGYWPKRGIPRVVPNGAWYELKAKNGALYLSSNQYQIKGHIDNLSLQFSRQIQTSNFRPVLWLVTTADVKYSASIASHALGKNVSYGHAHIEYRIVNNTYQFKFSTPQAPGR
ncbi:DUF6443 domain-containing protein [Hymenobacter saemangeumensis]|uniref:DUF6443 domain-containing protein n=1 Tax=Hymenobacter saemangeumensis TaxID=1084522 RepID=UPI003CD06A34